MLPSYNDPRLWLISQPAKRLHKSDRQLAGRVLGRTVHSWAVNSLLQTYGLDQVQLVSILDLRDGNKTNNQAQDDAYQANQELVSQYFHVASKVCALI